MKISTPEKFQSVKAGLFALLLLVGTVTASFAQNFTVKVRKAPR